MTLPDISGNANAEDLLEDELQSSFLTVGGVVKQEIK
jgi:hypothetical protein